MVPKSALCLLTIFISAHCSEFNRGQLDAASRNAVTSNASDVAPDKYVSGGHPAGVSQFPWLARLSVRDRTKGSSFMCAGSLISTRNVLTAAHCVEHDIQEYTDVKIYLGDYDRRTYPVDCVKDKCTKNQLVYPDKVIQHDGYDTRTNVNDIALLRLQKRVHVSAYIKPIPLPPFNLDVTINDGASLLVAGWGTTEDGESSNILLSTEVGLISKRRCLETHPKVPQGHLCAGSTTGKDTCPGDSGGPLMMYYKKKYYLAGVISYGPNVDCGTAEVGYYTNVYKYMKWIKTNIKV